jgi:tripartite-type tricarboxylate transporter receptor subunit TctC
MQLPRRDFIAASAAALALPGTSVFAQQPWPSKPIKGINPFQAGGPSDFLGRMIGDKLAQRLGQPFVMENRPGAGGNVGIDALAKSAPDGHTLAWVVDFNITVNPVLYPKMPYDVEKDIQTICTFAAGEVALVVHPSVPVSSLKELIALAKAKPLAFASGGNGSPGHMIGEMFKRELGLEQMTHIPYKGNAPAVMSIVSGETQVFFGALPGTLQHIRAGKLKPLAVMSNERSTFIPDVPTSKELGFPKLLAGNWFGVIAPAGTPKDITDRLYREIAVIVKDKDYLERLDKAGLKPFLTTPEQMRAMMRSESAAWAAVVKSANIRPE